MGEETKGAYKAVMQGDAGAARKVFSEYPRLLGRRGPFFGTWLHDAARRDSPEMIRCLVDLGLNVNDRADHGETPLMTAAAKGAMLNVRCLLELGADLHAQDQWRATALVQATAAGHLPVVQELVARGAQLDVFFGEARWKTLIEKALEFGRHDIAKYLRGLGAPERAPEGMGEPPCDLDRLLAHVESHVGPLKQYIARKVDEVLNIHLALPKENPDSVILVSSREPHDIGTIMRPPDDANQDIRFAEFAIQLPRNWPLDKQSLKKPENFWPVERMGIVSWLPSLDNVWLGEEPLIVSNDEPPQPLGKGTKLTCTMLIKDATVPPLRMEYGKVVHFYTLIPLYTEERNFEKRYGVKALLKLFKDAGLDFTINPKRANLALGK